MAWSSFESFNIHKCTFTSRKSLNICTWSSAPYTVTEKLQYTIKGPMKVISGLLPETWGYFCMKNCISTTRNCHSHIHESTHFILFALLMVHPRFFLRLACGPPKLIGPGRHPPPPSQWAWMCVQLTMRKMVIRVEDIVHDTNGSAPCLPPWPLFNALNFVV
jgi:hypothetical protein